MMCDTDSSPNELRVIAKTAYDAITNQPSRQQVREDIFHRRSFQFSNEGLHCPNYRPYRSLGHPMRLKEVDLIKSAIGNIPRLPAMSRFKLTIDEQMDVDEIDEKQTNLSVENQIELSSESGSQSMKKLHPKFFDTKTFKSRDTKNKGISKYTERRRKSGVQNWSDILAESNRIAKLTDQGRSYFDLLYKAARAKVEQYWNERRKIKLEKTTLILPPKRRYFEEFHEDGHKDPAQYEELLRELYEAELKLEAASLEEDNLLAKEVEMMRETRDLFPDDLHIMDVATLRPTMEFTSSASTHSSAIAVERRRQRTKTKWQEEQPRPYAPMFLNVNNPEMGESVFEMGMMIQTNQKDEASQSPDIDEQLKRQEESVVDEDILPQQKPEIEKEIPVSDDAEINRLKSMNLLENISSNSEEKDENYIANIIYSQLCALFWILEQMLSKGNDQTASIKPIFFSWSERSSEKQSIASLVDVDAQWRDFLLHTEEGAGKRFRMESRASIWSDKCLQSRKSLRRMSRISLPKIEHFNPKERYDAENSAVQKSSDASESNWYQEYLIDEHAPPIKAMNVDKPKIADILTPEKFREICQTSLDVQALRKMLKKETLKKMVSIVERDIREQGNVDAKRASKLLATLSVDLPVSTKTTKTECQSEKHRRFIQAAPKKLADRLESQAIELHEKFQQMKELRNSVALSKYQAIPSDASFHEAFHRLAIEASYANAFKRSTQCKLKQKEPASWFTDLLHDIGDTQENWKISHILNKLEYFAQIPLNRFTVTQFTRTIRRLELWELCSPMVAAAIDFVRTKILDMTLEEYTEWLYEIYPNIPRIQKPKKK